ncbi:hypothetical protein POTOM_039671 [Populus tomentosa]|uniref:Peptidase M48 domain-containing protein n=1 Tax=Populus tomentosa TaxID=118781 RepID=A0A8X8CBR7_POPTO|nr:hypothetical protein POTOM_039671 [Populus tomentosa]
MLMGFLVCVGGGLGLSDLVVFLQHTVIPLQHLVSFGLNLVSRSFEFQADAFAKKLGYGSALRGGLV